MIVCGQAMIVCGQVKIARRPANAQPAWGHIASTDFIHAEGTAAPTGPRQRCEREHARRIRPCRRGRFRTFVGQSALLVHVHARTESVKLGHTQAVAHRAEQPLQVAELDETRAVRVQRTEGEPERLRR